MQIFYFESTEASEAKLVSEKQMKANSRGGGAFGCGAQP